ncbi:hypothetical protein T265_16326, partial [Opisthorchis viverrini]
EHSLTTTGSVLCVQPHCALSPNLRYVIDGVHASTGCGRENFP